MIKKGDTVKFTQRDGYDKAVKLKGIVKEVIREKFGKSDVIIEQGAVTLQETKARVNRK